MVYGRGRPPVGIASTDRYIAGSGTIATHNILRGYGTGDDGITGSPGSYVTANITDA